MLAQAVKATTKSGVVACMVVLSVASPGCGPEPEPPPVDTGPALLVSQDLSGNRRFIWEREGRPYVVRNLEMTESENGQKRVALVVMDHPQTKKEVLIAAREIFDAFWDDITSFGAAKFQRIQIFVFCCEDDAIDNDGYQIFEASGGGLNATALPKFAQAKTKWQWREPKDKPDDETLKVFRDFWNGRQNILGKDTQAEATLVEQIAQSHGITNADVAEKVGECWIWRNCQSVNDVRKADEKRRFMERWGFSE